MPRVIVAGAGIGGLCAALALADAGVTVEVIERAPSFEAVGAGLQLSPNATRVLARLGVLDVIKRSAVAPRAVRIRRGTDGAELGRVPLGHAAEERFGAPFLLAHRADVHAALLDAVRACPAIRITAGQEVQSYGAGPTGVTVTIRRDAGIRIATADGLIGADGLRSRVRAARRLGPGGDPVYCGRTAWRAVVRAEHVAQMSRSPESNLWLGRKAHLVHYPVSGGTLINVVAIVEDEWQGESAPDLWSARGEAAVLRRRFEHWAEEPRALIGSAGDWRIWPLFDRPPLARWSDGPVTLLGDAAHPMLPFLAQGAAQAIEDAGALGEAMRRDSADLTRAFAAYEAVRRAKAERVQRDSRRQGAIYHLGQPAASLRDLALRALGENRMLARYDWLYGAPRQPTAG